jgi:hypothetical protein
MAERNVRVRGVRRKQIDEDKLALAFLLLAKTIHEQDQATADATRDEQAGSDEPEAA